MRQKDGKQVVKSGVSRTVAIAFASILVLSAVLWTSPALGQTNSVSGTPLDALSLPQAVKAVGFVASSLAGVSGPQTVGEVHSALDSYHTCVAVGSSWGGGKTSDSLNAYMLWTGTVTSARLEMYIANTHYEHSVYINDHYIGTVPIIPYGAECQILGSPNPVEIWFDPSFLVQGANTIKITNDAGQNDWSAANLLIVGSGSGVNGAFIDDVWFESSYDSTSQTAAISVPGAYNPDVPAPLVIALHWWGGNLWDGLTWFGPAANKRNWLVASPDLRGENTVGGGIALASRVSQHDTIDLINYMKSNYNVDSSRIYITGVSMGGMQAAVTAEKYPDIFAAAVEYKGPSDLIAWYNDSKASESEAWRTFYIEQEVGGTPLTNPFGYERRSAVQMGRNLLHVPFAIVHGTQDTMVLPHHAEDLWNAIATYGPDNIAPIAWYVGNHGDPENPFTIDWAADWLSQSTLNSNPTGISIKTDESKPYYWLGVSQTGGDHWTEVRASFFPVTKTIAAVVSDTNSVGLSFDLNTMGLGSVPTYTISDRDILRGTTNRYTTSPVSNTLTVSTGNWLHELTIYAGTPVPTPTSTSTPTPTPTSTVGPTPTVTPTPTAGPSLNHRVFLPAIVQDNR